MMIKNIFSPEYPTSFDDIGSEIRVGIMLMEDKEYYFLLGKNTDGKYSIPVTSNILEYGVPVYGKCDSGNSLCDLIGSIEETYGVSTGEDVIEDLKELLENIEANHKGDASALDTAQYAVKLFQDYCTYGHGDLFTNPQRDPKYNKQCLIVLPLLAEILNGLKEKGKEYNFKNCMKLFNRMKASQKYIAAFANDIMFYENNKYPRAAYGNADLTINDYPSTDYAGITRIFDNPWIDNYDGEDDRSIGDLFLADSFDDLVSFFVNKYLTNGLHFYLCPNCNRYFAFTSDTKTKYCSRPILVANKANDIGKTCREVGRLRNRTRKIFGIDANKLYQQNYAKAFYRKNKGEVSEDAFAVWGTAARKQRDLCLEGAITYQDLEEWFDKNRLVD